MNKIQSVSICNCVTLNRYGILDYINNEVSVCDVNTYDNEEAENIDQTDSSALNGELHTSNEISIDD